MSICGGKQKSKSSQTGTSTTTADPASLARYNEQSQGILNTATNYAQTPYQKFEGPMVAGLSADEQRARQIANGSAGAWKGILDDSEGAVRGAMNFGKDDIDFFADPYEREVIDSSLALFDENAARQLNEYNDGVTARSAFGNSSASLGEGELRRGTALDRTNLSANMKSANYKAAVDNAFRKQQADYQGAGILGNIAGQRQQLTSNDIATLEQLGATERQIAQMQIDAERSEWDKAAADRLQKTLLELQARSGILGANPTGQTTNSSGTASGTTTSMGFQFAPKFELLGGKMSFGG